MLCTSWLGVVWSGVYVPHGYLHIYIYMRCELPWAAQVFATFLWLLSSTNWLPRLLMLHRRSGSCSVWDCWINLVLLLPGVITWRVYNIYTLDFLESLWVLCVCVCWSNQIHQTDEWRLASVLLGQEFCSVSSVWNLAMITGASETNITYGWFPTMFIFYKTRKGASAFT